MTYLVDPKWLYKVIQDHRRLMDFHKEYNVCIFNMNDQQFREFNFLEEKYRMLLVLDFLNEKHW